MKGVGLLIVALVIASIWVFDGGGSMPKKKTSDVSTNCGTEEAKIKAMIAAANYCTTDADCIPKSACPFGDLILINKTKEQTFDMAIQSYKDACNGCKYDQRMLRSKKCRENVCIGEPL